MKGVKEKVGGVEGVVLASICCDSIEVAAAAAEGAMVARSVNPLLCALWLLQ